jgi:hypothetical protein
MVLDAMHIQKPPTTFLKAVKLKCGHLNRTWPPFCNWHGAQAMQLSYIILTQRMGRGYVNANYSVYRVFHIDFNCQKHW